MCGRLLKIVLTLAEASPGNGRGEVGVEDVFLFFLTFYRKRNQDNLLNHLPFFPISRQSVCPPSLYKIKIPN